MNIPSSTTTTTTQRANSTTTSVNDNSSDVINTLSQASFKSPHDALHYLTTRIKASHSEAEYVNLLYARATIFVQMNMVTEAEKDCRSIVTKLSPCHTPTWKLITHVLQSEKHACVDLLVPHDIARAADFERYSLPIWNFIQQQKTIPPTTTTAENNNVTPTHNKGLTCDSKDEIPEELECPLCYRVFHQPITLPCGHSFDKVCLARVFDYTSKCPLCRLQIHILPTEIPVSVTLQTIVEKYYSSDHRARLEESSKEDAIILAESEVCSDVELPLFVLGDYVLYPGTKLALHVFEPRYRLLMRRCLSGSRQFGLISTNGRTLSRYGTVAKIINFTQLDDGRSLVETVGGRRFSIDGDPWQVDGYYLARVSFFKEEIIPDSDRAVVDDMARKLEALLDSFFSEVGPEMQMAIEQKIGSLPPRENIVDRSFWLASLLPLRAENKLGLLKITSTSDRLAMLNGVCGELTSRQDSSCAVQ
jgi:Lon protease-like protein